MSSKVSLLEKYHPKTVDDIIQVIENKQGGFLIEGMYEDIPGKKYYAFGLDS